MDRSIKHYVRPWRTLPYPLSGSLVLQFFKTDWDILTPGFVRIRQSETVELVIITFLQLEKILFFLSRHILYLLEAVIQYWFFNLKDFWEWGTWHLTVRCNCQQRVVDEIAKSTLWLQLLWRAEILQFNPYLVKRAQLNLLQVSNQIIIFWDTKQSNVSDCLFTLSVLHLLPCITRISSVIFFVTLRLCSSLFVLYLCMLVKYLECISVKRRIKFFSW